MSAGSRVDVAIVGAGPFGLSVAAHLAGNFHVRVFGRAMRTWRELMPRDMLLRSDWNHTNLSAPNARGTLTDWAAATGELQRNPLPLEMFLRYSDWFVSRFVPHITDDRVEKIECLDNSFVLSTLQGERVTAGSVVLALGVTPFTRIPTVFRDQNLVQIPPPEATSSKERLDDLRVVIVGGGQNGLEAALRAIRGGAASVDIVVRSHIRWFADHEPHHDRGPVRSWLYRLAYPIVGFGPPPVNRLVRHPDLFARLPESIRDRINTRLLRAGGSPWLREQLVGNVVFHEGALVDRLEPLPKGVIVHLTNQKSLSADRVIIACGYQFDLEKITCLSTDLRRRIEVRPKSGWPVLTGGFCTTCPGLYFVGYPSEGQFGPMSRFVEGTRFAAERCSASMQRR